MKEISILFTRHERRIESQTIGFYDLKFSHIAIDFSFMSHDIQWLNKGSSCILLRSSMSKVSCLKIHNDRKEISSSFVTRKKIVFNRRPKKKNPIRQIRLNDRLNNNADIQINIPDLEVAYLSSHEGFTKLRHFCLKLHNLTPSTIKSCLPNWRTMVSVTWLCSGLKATFLAASNLSNSIKLALQCKPSSVVSLKARFQALYCSFCK